MRRNADDSKLGRLKVLLPIVEDYLRWTGGEVYIGNVLRLLSLPEIENRAAVYLENDSHLGDAEIATRYSQYAVVAAVMPREKGWMQLRSLAPLLLGSGRRSAVHVTFPVTSADPQYRRYRNPVFWIPDFQHKVLPEHFSAEEIAGRDAAFERVARRRAALLLSSHATAADFRRFFLEHRVKVHVWQFCSAIAADDAAPIDPRVAFNLPERFLYIPNQFWTHKDHLTAFRALRLLRDRGLTVHFVCTGNTDDYRNRDYYRVLQDYLRDADLTGCVTILGVLPRPEQLAILRHTAAVLQPSLFEGWSTVVEDNRAIGRPIFLSDIPVHVEQAPETGTFFKARDAESLASAIAAAWPRLRPGPDRQAEAAAQTLATKRRAACARRLLDILMEAAGAPTSTPSEVSGSPSR